MTRKDSVPTFIKCPWCGNKQQIWRKTGRQKSIGHIKDIYCPFCKTDVKGIEVKNDYINMLGCRMER